MGAPIKFTADQAAWMREHYATTMNKDCCEHLGVSMRTVRRFAISLGLEKDPDFVRGLFRANCKLMAEANRYSGNAGAVNLLKGAKYRFRKGETSRERLGDEREAERIRKAAASRRETVRKERMRVRWGFPQRTKLKLVYNSRKGDARWKLRKRGYHVGRGASVAYYDGGTDRRDALEQAAMRVGIDILPLANVSKC